MCGNTMMSLSGSAGRGRRALVPGLSLGSFLKNIYRGATSTDAGLLVINDQGRFAGIDRFFADHDLLDSALRGDLVHDVEHRLFQDGSEAARAALTFERLACDGVQRGLAELELDAVHLEQLLELLDQTVPG